MTARTAAAALVDDIADVDATIAYWRNRGVGAAMVASQLRCYASWPAIRAAMIAMQRAGAAAELRAAA